jgi:hypothetical protein
VPRGGPRSLAGLGGTLVLAVAIAGCAAPGTADGEWQSGGGSPSAPVEQVATITTATVGAEEAKGLLWMREEEKLARDVYLALDDLWNVRVFSNIARAEQAHMDALETLLDQYGLQDPTAGNPEGVFTDPAIQALYDELLARGRTSLVEALKVGATIEDLDIVDLRERATDTPDIARVYANLEQGSENHLRAFVTNLERRGATYTPAYLALADFDRIISTPRTRGGTGASEAYP